MDDTDNMANMGDMARKGITAFIPYDKMESLLICPNNFYTFTRVLGGKITKEGGVEESTETYTKQGKELTPSERDLICGTFVHELDKLRFEQSKVGGR